MAEDMTTVEVSSDSELWEKLHHAAESGQRLRIESATGDGAFEVNVHAAAGAASDSDADRAAHTVAVIRRATGAWKGHIDVEAFLEEHYERRRMISRPPVNLDQ